MLLPQSEPGQGMKETAMEWFEKQVIPKLAADGVDTSELDETIAEAVFQLLRVACRL